MLLKKREILNVMVLETSKMDRSRRGEKNKCLYMTFELHNEQP